MFNDNKQFWMSFREGWLMILNAVEVGMRQAGVLSGPTTAEIRAWWKDAQKRDIMPVQKESDNGL